MRMWYRLFKYVLIGPALLVTCRPRIVGRDLLPPTGPVIVAATHSAFIDSLLLCLVLPRRLTFVAKSDYFDRPGLRGRMQRWFFLAAGQTPIDRSGGDRAATTLATATSLVSGGGAWAIHPEGTRSCDGRVHRGHTGVMRVARATGAPVVPIALRGTERVNPPGRLMWRPHRVDIVIGFPVPVDQAMADDDLRSATDRLMIELAAMAGRPYENSYAERRPQAPTATP